MIPPDSGLWFDLNSLGQRTASVNFVSGLMLYRSQKVLSLGITPKPDHFLVAGQVQGVQREPHQVSVRVVLTPAGQLTEWQGRCDCNAKIQCAHAVALLIKATYQGRNLLGPAARPQPASAEDIEAARQAAQERAEALAAARQAEQERLEEIERRQAESHLLDWMTQLEAATSRAAGPVSVPGRQADERAEQLLYLVRCGNSNGVTKLMFEVTLSYCKRDGGWAKPRQARADLIQNHPIYGRASEVDRQVLQLMLAMPEALQYRHSYVAGLSVTPQGQLGQMLLEQAASTGRLYLKDERDYPQTALRWGPPLNLEWGWHEVTTRHSAEPGWTLRARLPEAGPVLCQNSPPLYLDGRHGVCGAVEAAGVPTTQLEVLLKSPVLKSSALQKHQINLMQRLGPVPVPPIIEKIESLSGITPQPCLHLVGVAADQIRSEGLMQAQLLFDYAGYRGFWSTENATVLVENAHGRRLLQRDLEAERAAWQQLLAFGLGSDGEGRFRNPDDQQTWLHWADNDYAELRQAGFEVTVDAALADWIRHADALEVQMQSHGDDEATSPWFDLSLGMEINGQRHNILPWLPELIAVAARSRPDPDTGLPNLPPYIFVSDSIAGGFIRLPTESLKPWIAALLELVGERAHDFSGDSLRLSRMDALRASATLGEGAVWQGAQVLREMLQQLSGKAEIPEVAVPAGVQAELRRYQRQGLNWLQFLRQHGLCGILADDMGLGKTLQTLAHIQLEKDAGRLHRPALIIAPVSLLGNWQREAARFCPDLRSLVIHGTDRHERTDRVAEHDLVITSYSLLARDRAGWLQQPWYLVVLDEAQNIKNATTQAAQAVGELDTRHRLCLSGTPMENHLGEIWSLFHFLMPGFLGSQKRFQDVFRKPIEKMGSPERLAQLRARITPFMLRRTKALVAAELPPKIETVMRVELTGKQADLYETIRLGMEKTVREALSSKGLAQSQITILDALLKLRQVCCDPRLLKLDAAKKVKTSAKLEQLMEILPEMLTEGRRILLFSQFTSMLELIEVELAKHELSWVKLTGQSQHRDALIERFTSGRVPLFLISLKAGGTGLNLPQADTVIHYDPWWNPAVENQATDRAHRIGQTQSVWVVKLVAQGTIEERILALQERKAALAESMYSGSTARKQPLFTESDLAELLKPLSA